MNRSPMTSTIHGLLHPADGWYWSDDDEIRVLIETAAGRRWVVCRSDLHSRFAKPGHAVPCSMLLTRGDGHEPKIVDLERSWWPNPLQYIDRTRCPVPDVVEAVADLAGKITSPILRRFLCDVMLRADLLDRYWLAPASTRPEYHHCYPGGLAEHSCELAAIVCAALSADPASRDIGIVVGLCHDVGKAVREGQQRKLHHKIVGLTWLAPELDALRVASPALASLISDLLRDEWRWDPRRGVYPPAIASLLRAADRYSAERSRLMQTAR